MKLLTKISFFLLVLTQLCLAQWIQTNGPYGGNVSCLVISGSNLFAGNWGAGVFISTNNGANWSAINHGLTSTDVQCLTDARTNI